MLLCTPMLTSELSEMVIKLMQNSERVVQILLAGSQNLFSPRRIDSPNPFGTTLNDTYA